MSLGEFFSGFKRGQKEFGESLGAIVNTALLTFIYVFGIGLTSLIAKLSGKRFLETKIEQNRDSYWTELNLGKKEMEEYYRQF